MTAHAARLGRPTREEDIEAMLGVLRGSKTKSLSNKVLRENLRWEENRYVSRRKEALDSDLITLGRGRGGTVRLQEEPSSESSAGKTKEKSYYPMLEKKLPIWCGLPTDEDGGQKTWVDQTAYGGKKGSGKWTRPDFTIVSVRPASVFIHYIEVQVMTFEVKLIDAFGVEAIYEASNQGRSASECWVVVVADKQSKQDRLSFGEDYSGPLQRARQLGVGVVLAVGKNTDLWVVHAPARRLNRTIGEIDLFVGRQFDPKKVTEIRDFIDDLVERVAEGDLAKLGDCRCSAVKNDLRARGALAMLLGLRRAQVKETLAKCQPKTRVKSAFQNVWPVE